MASGQSALATYFCACLTDLFSAVMGTVGTINEFLYSTCTLMPSLYERVSLSGRAMKWLVFGSAVRWFGYLAAIFDADTTGAAEPRSSAQAKSFARNQSNRTYRR